LLDSLAKASSSSSDDDETSSMAPRRLMTTILCSILDYGLERILQ
jgi:hypothetical protein